MKKTVMILFITIMLLVSVVAVAEGIAKYYSEYIDSPVEVGVVGNRLFLICDYEKAMNVGKTTIDPEDIEAITKEFNEELKGYDFIVFIYTKNGMAYVMAEVPIVDGIASKTANGLMSQTFILENMRLGN